MAMIYALLAVALPGILFAGGVTYESEDMQIGINTAGLVTFAALIKPLFVLDHRGAYIGQKFIEAAVNQVVHTVDTGFSFIR